MLQNPGGLGLTEIQRLDGLRGPLIGHQDEGEAHVVFAVAQAALAVALLQVGGCQQAA
ncbi:hypothetical protein D3C78_1587640 [compost metagenome]